MSDAAGQNPIPPPVAGEGPGPFAFPGHNAEPVNPTFTPGSPGHTAPAMRDQQVVPAHDPDVAAELQLLREIRDTSKGSPANLAVSEYAPPSVTEIDHPVPGVRRWLLPRVPVGGQITVPEALTDVVATDHARLGGSIVNSGTKAIVLALTRAKGVTPLTARVFLAAEGGAWDLRLSGITWCGSISAEARGGESQLEVVVL
jgi:hypothetical protein